jgi:small subunit ribosomal protein S8e
MGISRDSRHKRRNTGGKKANLKKKRQYEAGRPPAMTKLGAERIRQVRCRGGNIKHRALRLETGSFSWGSEVITRKTRVLDVVYNASNNELVRTKTLVKGAIVLIDASPFKTWYEAHYGVSIGLKKGKKEEPETVSRSEIAQKKIDDRQKKRTPLATDIDNGFSSGRLYACISSRPGQSGRCDGYILEGKELDFYTRQLKKRKGGK